MTKIVKDRQLICGMSEGVGQREHGEGVTIATHSYCGWNRAIQLSKTFEITRESAGGHRACILEGVALCDASSKGWKRYDVATLPGRLKNRCVGIRFGLDRFLVGHDGLGLAK